MVQTAADVRIRIGAVADETRALFLRRFFRTGPGEYAEGDVFCGVTVPEIRRIAADFRTLPVSEIELLIQSPVHEHRLAALVILCTRHKRAGAEERTVLRELYLRQLNHVNNWDLVDGSAAEMVGQELRSNRALRNRLVKSQNVWLRRIAIVGTFAELRAGRTDLTFEIARCLLADKHELIHKATGWLLREAGKRCEPDLIEFLRSNYARLPRTTLRYAIERFAPERRRLWLAGPV